MILNFDGRPVDERNDLPKIVAAAQVGKTVKVVVFRDGKEREFKVEVGKLGADEAAMLRGRGVRRSAGSDGHAVDPGSWRGATSSIRKAVVW